MKILCVGAYKKAEAEDLERETTHRRKRSA